MRGGMAFENTIIVVNDEPYCVWAADLRERNVEFLKGVDPGYFGYLIDRHRADEGKEPTKDEERRAAILLKNNLLPRARNAVFFAWRVAASS
jgi:hypothetical protein